MDIGGQAHEKPSRLLFKHDFDPPLPPSMGETSKRQRSADDNQDQLLQQPPQTRRMIGMGLGFPSGSTGSGGSSGAGASPFFSTSQSRNDFSARVSVANLVSSPPNKLTIGRDASASSTSDGRSSGSKGSGSTMFSSPSSLAESEEIENESREEKVGAGGGFDYSKISTSKSTSKSKSPEVAAGDRGVGSGRSSSSSSSSYDWVYTVEKNDVDEHELGHRLSYLQMRGYDQALLTVMDEGIFEDSESSEEFSGSASESGHTEQVESQHEQQYTAVEVSFDPLDRPAIVTPERL